MVDRIRLETKICCRCGEEKSRTDFYNCNRSPGESGAMCKACVKAYAAEWRDSKRDHIRDYNKERYNPEYFIKRYQENREEMLAQGRAHRALPETQVKLKNYRQRFYQANKPKFAAGVRKYQARKLKACPVWADQKAILQFYERAAFLTKTTGIKFHVDHIYPLRGKTMCGLHIAANLQILPGIVNDKKFNNVKELKGDPLCCAWPLELQYGGLV